MPEKNETPGIPVGKPDDEKEPGRGTSPWDLLGGFGRIEENEKKRAEQYAQELAHVQKHRDALERLQDDGNKTYLEECRSAQAHRKWIQEHDEERMALVKREVEALEKISETLDVLASRK